MNKETFELWARIRELKNQRNLAFDNIVEQSAQLALAGKRIGELELKIESLNKEISEMKPCQD